MFVSVTPQCVANGVRYDMVLVDENMREVNGTTAIVELRKYEQHHKLPPMPVVTTTGNTCLQDVARYFGFARL